MPSVYLVNPSRRRKRKSATTSTKKRRRVRARRARSLRRNPIGFAAANPRRRRRSVRRSFRRNPSGILRGFSLKGSVMPALVGAGGAIGADLAMGYLPIPDAMKTGPVRPLVRLGLAVGVGIAAGAMFGRDIGNKVTLGGLTVVGYDTAKSFLLQNMPQLPLAGVGEFPLMEYATPGMGALIDVDAGMGSLVDESSISGMGELVDESSISGMGAIFDPMY